MRNGVRAYLEDGIEGVWEDPAQNDEIYPDAPPQPRLVPNGTPARYGATAPVNSAAATGVTGYLGSPLDPETGEPIMATPDVPPIGSPAPLTGTGAPMPPPPHAGRSGVTPAGEPSYDLNASYDALKHAVLDNPPKLTPPKPWQRVVSGALGGLAGWSNASSRTRTPIDINAMTQGILHPGYGEKVAEYESRLGPLKQAAEIEGQRFAAEERAEQIRGQAEERLAHAQQRRNMADPHYNQVQLDPAWVRENLPAHAPDKNGEYWIDKSQAVELEKEAGKLTSVAPGATLYRGGKIVGTGGPKPITNEFEMWREEHPEGTAKDWAKFQQESKAGKNLNIIDVLLHPEDFTPEQQKTAHDLFNQEHHGENLLADEMKRMRLKREEEDDRYNILKDKERRENGIKQEHQSALRTITSNTQLNTPDRKPERDQLIANANAKAQNELQTIQDNYVNTWRQRGLQADDLDIKPRADGGWDYTPRQKGPAPTTPGPWASGYVMPPKAPAGPRPVAGAGNPGTPYQVPGGTLQVPGPGGGPIRLPGQQPPAQKPAPQKQGGGGPPVELHLPNGRVKIFPNEDAAKKFAEEAGLAFK